MSYPNRAPTRKVIASLLATALTGVANVENYLVLDPNGKAPLVCVTSAGTGPVDEDYGDWVTDLYYEIRVMCIHSAAGWGADESEDQADGICKIVLDTIHDNGTRQIDAGGVGWSRMTTDRPTLVAIEPIGGNKYRTEIIPIAVRVTLG